MGFITTNMKIRERKHVYVSHSDMKRDVYHCIYNRAPTLNITTYDETTTSKR